MSPPDHINGLDHKVCPTDFHFDPSKEPTIGKNVLGNGKSWDIQKAMKTDPDNKILDILDTNLRDSSLFTRWNQVNVRARYQKKLGILKVLRCAD